MKDRKIIQIEDETYWKLIDFKNRVALKDKKRITFNDAINMLIDLEKENGKEK
ncbi:MAG: hypothetical protein QW478_13540 [Candidatus Micrarchaeaceae archaeon]